MYDINVLIHSVNNLIRNKYWYTFFCSGYFWCLVFHNTCLYLNAAFTRYDTTTTLRHQSGDWQNLNFLKSEIYFFTFSPHFTFIVKFLVNYRIFPDYLQKGFLKISFEKSFISLHLELRTPQTDISRLGSSPQCFRF